MVYCESLSVWPVRISTARSSGVTLPSGDELSDAGERDGRGGFAADALGADLRLGEGDLLFGHLLAPPARASSMTAAALRQEAGLPMRIAVARVSAVPASLPV